MDFSITVRDKDDRLSTLAATDPLAEQIDAPHYELHEGPCYAAVTDERFVMFDDMGASTTFPHFGPRAARLGVGAQGCGPANRRCRSSRTHSLLAPSGRVQPVHRSVCELFAGQASALLDYAVQVEQLGEALHARTDIGTAVGIVMERYG